MAIAFVIHSQNAPANADANYVVRYMNYFAEFNGKEFRPMVIWTTWDMNTKQKIWRTLIEISDADGKELFPEADDKIFVLNEFDANTNSHDFDLYSSKVLESMEQISRVSEAADQRSTTVKSNEFEGTMDVVVVDGNPEAVFSAIRQDTVRANEATPKH